jgi:hypothetical protein
LRIAFAFFFDQNHAVALACRRNSSLKSSFR